MRSMWVSTDQERRLTRLDERAESSAGSDIAKKLTHIASLRTVEAEIMTTAEYVKELLDLAMQTHGEDAPVGRQCLRDEFRCDARTQVGARLSVCSFPNDLVGSAPLRFL